MENVDMRYFVQLRGLHKRSERKIGSARLHIFADGCYWYIGSPITQNATQIFTNEVVGVNEKRKFNVWN